MVVVLTPRRSAAASIDRYSLDRALTMLAIVASSGALVPTQKEARRCSVTTNRQPSQEVVLP